MTGRALKHVAVNLLSPGSGSRIGNHATKTKVIVLTDGRSQDSVAGTVSKYQQKIKVKYFVQNQFIKFFRSSI